ncbi:MAG: hypothetical protein R3303_03675 [Marinobacter sp.]|nr:hypothetical protein [Marinobacter sp.]
MNAGSLSSAVSQQYLQLATSPARQQVQAPASNNAVVAPQQAEETSEPRAVQATEGETGGRINTYA